MNARPWTWRCWHCWCWRDTVDRTFIARKETQIQDPNHRKRFKSFRVFYPSPRIDPYSRLSFDLLPLTTSHQNGRRRVYLDVQPILRPRHHRYHHIWAHLHHHLVPDTHQIPSMVFHRRCRRSCCRSSCIQPSILFNPEQDRAGASAPPPSLELYCEY